MTEPRVTYRRSPLNEWTRPAFRRLSADAKLVLLAARLGPSSTMIGVSYCPAAMLAAYTGLDVARVEAAERELAPEALQRDTETDELFVANGVEHQVGETLKAGDKRIPHILGLLIALHSETLRNRWLAAHPEFASQFMTQTCPSEGASQAPSKPVAVAVAVAGAGAAAGAAACAATGEGLQADIQPPAEAGGGLVAPPASPAGDANKLPETDAELEWAVRIAAEAAELNVTLEPLRVWLALRDVVDTWRPEELAQAVRAWAGRLSGPGNAFGLRNYLDKRGHVFRVHGEAA